MTTYVFDIDGTISQYGKKVSVGICENIYALSKKHTILFASARPVRDILPMLDPKLHNKNIFIGCNGGMAYCDQTFLFCRELSCSYIEYAIRKLRDLSIPYILDGKWDYALSQTPHPFHDYIRKLSKHEIDEEQLIIDGVTKLLVLSNKDTIKPLVNTFDNKEVSIHIHSTEGIFDITPKNNNKFYALKKIIQGDYIAFGNDHNDFLMLDNARKSIFIGSEKTYAGADVYLDFEDVEEFILKLSAAI